ncbi:HPr family phosphocarrier protein [Bacillus licheniformis]|nr:HPr family phosphocarrier protein [Bacillus licheniformis]
MEILQLGVQEGDEITLMVYGTDEQAAKETLENFFECSAIIESAPALIKLLFIRFQGHCLILFLIHHST